MDSLKAAVIAYLREALPPEPGGAPARVLNAYPKGLELLPCVSVVRTAGGLDHQFVGEGATEPYQREDSQWVDAVSAYWREGVEVTAWDINPKARDQVAIALRMALWRMVRFLSDTEDVHEMRISEEGDGQDLESRAPADVFFATYNVSALVPIAIETPVDIAEGIEVSGEWNLET